VLIKIIYVVDRPYIDRRRLNLSYYSTSGGCIMAEVEEQVGFSRKNILWNDRSLWILHCFCMFNFV